MSTTIDPAAAKALLHSGEEVAFLDLREDGQFGEGHAFLATPCPYSRLELRVPGLVPVTSVPVVLIDDGDGVAERGAARLEALGYSDVRIVAGGMPGWRDAGFGVFKGVNVPSKTLGEMAEIAFHPAMVDAETLADWQSSGRRFVFFDVRPPAEHAKMRVPGARCMPIGELIHRFEEVVPDPDVPVLVTCAGRTRGLIGASGLQFAGVPNPVFALENGTQGWALAGFQLERGNTAEPFPDMSGEGRAASERRARQLAETWAIPFIDEAALDRLTQVPGRPLYLLDVRSAEEFAAGHRQDATHAPGGQLVQSTDQWVGVRHARIILCDDTGARAALAGVWLRQLGYEPFILAGLAGQGAASQRSVPASPAPAVPKPVAAGEAARDFETGKSRLLDLRESRKYRAGHARGAAWAIRPRLPAALAGHAGPVDLIVDEPEIAALAALDLAEAGAGPVRMVEGGFAAWASAGLPVEAGDAPADAEAIDFLVFVHDRHDGNLESSRNYLSWEQGLMAQLDPQERAEFRMSPPA